MRLPPRLSGLALLALAILGCGPGDPATVTVSGRITAGGRPLPNADVTFTAAQNPEPGNPPLTSSGKTDAQGRYSLKMDDGRRDGAVPGAYKVRISILDRGGVGRPAQGQLIPLAYNHNTILSFTVPPGGTAGADFNLPDLPQLAVSPNPDR